MVTHNNMNMEISILEINTESINTSLNNLPYLSDSRQLKSRYVHVAIKLPKIEYVTQ